MNKVKNRHAIYLNKAEQAAVDARLAPDQSVGQLLKQLINEALDGRAALSLREAFTELTKENLENAIEGHRTHVEECMRQKTTPQPLVDRLIGTLNLQRLLSKPFV
jgi:hypothetical protein